MTTKTNKHFVTLERERWGEDAFFRLNAQFPRSRRLAESPAYQCRQCLSLKKRLWDFSSRLLWIAVWISVIPWQKCHIPAFLRYGRECRHGKHTHRAREGEREGERERERERETDRDRDRQRESMRKEKLQKGKGKRRDWECVCKWERK